MDLDVTHDNDTRTGHGSRVGGKSGGIYNNDYMAVIENALLLGCDNVNMSFGRCGFFRVMALKKPHKGKHPYGAWVMDLRAGESHRNKASPAL